MKTRNILAALIILSGTAGALAAQEQASEKKLGITLDATYVSRYLWRGFDSYPKNHSGFQPSIDIDLYGTGFGINIWHSMANTSGFENSKEFDYTVYYYNSLFKDEVFATNYTLRWMYISYPDNSRKVMDVEELSATLSWPKILPFGLVPSYTAAYVWPAASHSGIRNCSGWFHIFELGYDLSLPKIMPNTDEQIVHFSAEVTYNDGAYVTWNPARYSGVDHDWSHAVFGISSPFQLAENLTFTPGFYYQLTMEESVNEHDEHWVRLSLTYTF